MKEHGKNPQDQTNEENIGSLPEKEFSIDSKDDPKSWKKTGGTEIEWSQKLRRYRKFTTKVYKK